MVDRNHPPETLREHDQWVCWTCEKQKKPPIAPLDAEWYARTDDPDTWASYDESIAYHERSDTDTEGVGFVLDESDSIAGADLDGCRNPTTGKIEPWARSVIDTLGSYTEISPSGTGLRVFVLGTLPEGRRKADQRRTIDSLRDFKKNSELELYDTDRYLTFTGDHLDGTAKRVYSRSDELEAIHGEYVAADDEDAETPSSSPQTNRKTDVTLDDRELLEKARNAKDGRKFSELYDRGGITRYESHSEADAALCAMLAFWTGGDQEQIDRLFRSSALIRPKWDEVHFSNGDTYGERTTKRANRVCSDYYSGERSASNVIPEPQPKAHSDGGRPIVSWPTLCRVGEALAELGAATTREISKHEAVDRSCRQVRRALRYLENTNIVESEPNGRSRLYKLTE